MMIRENTSSAHSTVWERYTLNEVENRKRSDLESPGYGASLAAGSHRCCLFWSPNSLSISLIGIACYYLGFIKPKAPLSLQTGPLGAQLREAKAKIPIQAPPGKAGSALAYSEKIFEQGLGTLDCGAIEAQSPESASSSPPSRPGPPDLRRQDCPGSWRVIMTRALPTVMRPCRGRCPTPSLPRNRGHQRRPR